MTKKLSKKTVSKKVAPRPKNMGLVPADPADALTVLIDVLSNDPIWTNNTDVRILCKMVGAHIIGQQDEIAELKISIDDALKALGCV